MARIDRVVTDSLTGEVVGDRVDLEAVLLQDVVARLDVLRVLDGLPRVEVIAPAGDLEPVIAPLAGKARDLLERKVGPLAGEQCDRSAHDEAPVGWLLPSSELAATASRTRWTARPSAKDGAGWWPAAMSLTKSTT